MEPKIYKPGAYKSPGIYKTPGIYNGRGVYKDGAGGGVVPGCFFLTYFEKFDEITGADKPVIGEPYILDIQKQKLTKSSLNIFGGVCTAIKEEYKESIDNVGFSKPIPENIDFISSELFILCEGTRSDYSSALGIDSTDILIDPYFSSTDFGLFGPYYTGSSSNYTMYNGTTRASSYFKFGKNIRYKTSHIAVTLDITNKIKRFYVDGDIMLEIRGLNATNYNFHMRQAASGKSFTITGVAFFSLDKSTNNGMNYPVPTQRYA